MTPTQAQLWQFLGQPSWHCAHPERLPLAPVAAAEVVIVVGAAVDTVVKTAAGAALDNKSLFPAHFVSDLCLALSLAQSQLRIISQVAWLKAGQPSARVLLGVNVSGDTQAFHWQGNFPLSLEQKRALWSCLCRCYLDH